MIASFTELYREYELKRKGRFNAFYQMDNSPSSVMLITNLTIGGLQRWISIGGDFLQVTGIPYVRPTDNSHFSHLR